MTESTMYWRSRKAGKLCKHYRHGWCYKHTEERQKGFVYTRCQGICNDYEFRRRKEHEVQHSNGRRANGPDVEE